MLGSRCEYGKDFHRKGSHHTRYGLSFIAFDFQRELLLIRAKLDMPDEYIPLALRPLDAELSFDDIVSQGIHIAHKEVWNPPSRHTKAETEFEVTVTVTCRRPPRFFTEFETNDDVDEDDDMYEGRGRTRRTFRRRATAMDFAITGVVSIYSPLFADPYRRRGMRDRLKLSQTAHARM